MATGTMRFNEYQEAFELGLTQVYRDELPKHGKQYEDWLVVEPAKRWFDTDMAFSGLGVMPQKGLGEAITTDKILKASTKQYSLTPYAIAIVIEHEAYYWDLYDVFMGLSRDLAGTAVDRLNLLAYSLLLNGFSTTDTTYQIYSGEAIFSATHARLDGGTWANKLATDEALSYTAIQNLIVTMAKTVGERGRFVRIDPKRIITSWDQSFLLTKLLGNSWEPDSADRNINTVTNRFKLQTVWSVYLTQALYWFIDCDKSVKKIKMRMGESPDLVKDTDARTRNMVMSSAMSVGLAVYDSRGIAGSDGAA